MAELFKHGWPIWPAMIAAVVLGAVLGAFNGFLVTRIGLPSLAVTIGTLTLYRGIAQGILPTDTIGGFPANLASIGVVPIPRHAHPVLDRVLRRAGDRLRRRPPRDAARARDLRDRRRPGGSILRRHSRQADQVLAVRPLRDAERIRRRAVVAPLRVGALRLRRRDGALRRHDRPARRHLDLRRSRHDRRRRRGRRRSRLSSDGADGRPHSVAGSEHRRRRSPPRERDRPERPRSVPARPRAAAQRRSPPARGRRAGGGP